MSSATPNAGTSLSDLSGRTLGDYCLVRRLGRGGMADVYLADQISLRRQVALKILKPQLAADPSYVVRFKNEAQAVAAFVHPNILQIYEVGVRDGFHYIAQEYVQGQTLAQLVARTGPLDLARALSILRQAAIALHQAAARGIVHRDIKPENIMLSHAGQVKVADFGLARVGQSQVNLTEVGITMGTPLYMSPEQVEGRPLDPRSDLYSLGVTAYRILAGRPPFEGDTALALAVQHLQKTPARLEEHRPDLPAALCRIVHKLLEKKPADRYDTAKELLSDLRAIPLPAGATEEESWNQLDDHLAMAVTGRQEATAKLDSLMKEVSRVSSRQSPLRAWMALAVLAGVAFAGGAGLAWLRRGPPLLAGANAQQTHIAKQPTAADQFFFATLSSDPLLAFKAVREHYSENQYYCHRADQELALLYLRNDDYPAAMEHFSRLAAADDVEQQFRAFGLAGQVVVLALQGKHQDSVARLNDLWPLREHVTDPRMQQILRPAIASSREALGSNSGRDWQDWLDNRFKD